MDEGGEMMLSMEEVYQEYSNMVFKYILMKTNNEDVAEELTQETFYQAVRSADKYDYSCKVTSWLCAIAKNKLHEYWRRHPSVSELSEELEGAESPENQVVSKMEKLRIMKVIHNLPEPTREVIQLRLFGDLSFKEIGEVFDKTEDWARVTFYRGKITLRKELKEDE